MKLCKFEIVWYFMVKNIDHASIATSEREAPKLKVCYSIAAWGF